MKAMRCDRCNRFYIVTDRDSERPAYNGCYIFGIQLTSIGNNNLRKFDLCPDCAIEVYNYLNNILIEASEELGNEDIFEEEEDELVSRVVKQFDGDMDCSSCLYAGETTGEHCVPCCEGDIDYYTYANVSKRRKKNAGGQK